MKKVMKINAVIFKTEINTFLFNKDIKKDGYVYEWHGENVFHIHLHPSSSMYQSSSKCIFIKESSIVVYEELLNEYDWIIAVGNESCKVVTVYNDVNVIEVPDESNIFKRTQGMLEVIALKDKRVLIIGLGSGGSSIALELAKAGIGKFSLFDFDRMELHNLSRHTGYIKDLGRLKTDVIKESILGKNPSAQIDLFPVDVRKNIQLLEDEIKKADIVICATDTNSSRNLINRHLVANQKTGIYGWVTARAEGGEVFIYRPGGTCYACIEPAKDEITDIDYARQEGIIPSYTNNPDDVVQVGLASDIMPVVNLMVKLALVELSRGLDTGIVTLEEDFKGEFYMCVNRRGEQYPIYTPLCDGDNMPKILRWYPIPVTRDAKCPECNIEALLQDSTDETEAVQTGGTFNFDEYLRTNE